MLDANFKKNLFKAEIIFIIALVIVLPLIFFKPSITGYVPSDLFKQTLDFTLSESSVLDVRSSSDQPIYISSLSLSGEVIGEGDVAIYLSNKAGERVLVYTNVGQAKSQPNLITGAAIGPATAEATTGDSILIEHGETLSWPGDMGPSSSGDFVNTCIESCYLDPEQFTSPEFEIQVYVEPRTTVKITEIFYTLN